MSATSGILGGMCGEVVHHLYREPGDLLPFCGTTPGREPETGAWHTGHDEEMLLEASNFGLVCCTRCVSTDALGGWTPLCLSSANEIGPSD